MNVGTEVTKEDSTLVLWFTHLIHNIAGFPDDQNSHKPFKNNFWFLHLSNGNKNNCAYSIWYPEERNEIVKAKHLAQHLAYIKCFNKYWLAREVLPALKDTTDKRCSHWEK